MSKNRISRMLMRGVGGCLLILLISGLVVYIQSPPVALAQGNFAGGAGTESAPYLIATAAHLDNVRNYPGAHFRLIADINMGVAPYGVGEGWQPIGDATTPFSGTLDGDIYVIFNLTVNRPTTNYQGLFGYLDGATVKNIYLENVNVQGSQYTGGLAGRANNSTIEHAHVTGEVRGAQYTGGLVGWLGGGSAAYVSSAAVVRGGSSTGGLVGYMTTLGTTIYHAHSLGTVQSSGNDVGGLVGWISTYGSVIDSYSRAAVSGVSRVGGLVGYQVGSGTQIYRSYSTGVVTGTMSYVGGLVGRCDTFPVVDSYWDTQTSGQTTSPAGIGKTTAEMQQRETFINYNFYTLWQIDVGRDYPVFQDLSGYVQPQAVDLADLTGDGTPDNPYLITSAAELHAMRQALTATFQLANDIDLAATVTWDAGRGWTPIGDTTTPFSGALDGAGYTLRNLTINRPTTGYQGLFGSLDGATVKNLYLENVNVQGGQYVGGLAGSANNSTIEHIDLIGEINGGNNTGGLVGWLDGGRVSHVSGAVVVRGGEGTGGLVGYMTTLGSTIHHAYSLGRVVGGQYTGGVVGWVATYGSVVDSYSRAAVRGSSRVGGLVGFLGGANTQVHRSYSTGVVTGTGTYLGGLVGRCDSCTVAHSYWDTQTSGQPTSTGGAGRTTAQMQQRETFTNFNFYTLWQIDVGRDYPVFQALSGYAQPQAVDLADLMGDGTPGNPYLITRLDELNAIRQALTATFQLANDIDLAATVTWNAGQGWQPIGDTTTPFSGTLDGAGYTLRHLTVNRPTTNYQGLFGYLDGATVKNIYLENVSVQGSQYTGGLAGSANNSTIERAHVTGGVNGVQYTGGLVGWLGGGSVAYVSSAAVVRGGSATGGLVGYMTTLGTTIYHAYSLGSVAGPSYTGGLVGWIDTYGSVVDSYSRAAVSGSSRVGGLVGLQVGADTRIHRSYSTGLVIGTGSYVGGLVGRCDSFPVVDSYWDIQTSGQTGSPAGIGKTTAEMQQRETFINYNFYTLWQIDVGRDYPVFQDLSGYVQPQAVGLADLTGDGTPDTPYLITNINELHAMRQALTATFQLANDIDLAATVTWNAGRGWQPIGDTTTPFSGTLDGAGYTLRNLTINRPTTNYQGLFGSVDGATVKNFSLENVSVQGGQYVGGLAGSASNSTIENIHLIGEINGGNNTGGLIGYLSGGSVGYVSSVAVVRGGEGTGGLVGYMTTLGATIDRAYSLGRVVGGQYVGGLVGWIATDASVLDSYSRAAVRGSSRVGGLVGFLESASTQIHRSYSTGAVVASTYVGGLVGRCDACTVAYSFWDTQTSGQATSFGGMGRTTAQMQQEGTFTTWDFSNVWGIVEDVTYPYHLHMPGTLALAPIAHSHRNGASGEFTISVTANVTWTATTTDTWINLTGGLTGMNNGLITYTVDANPLPDLRTGSITVVSAGGDITRTFTVRQRAVFEITPQRRTHDAVASGGHPIGVTGNVTWTAQTDTTWITLTTGASGQDAGTVLYRLDDNLSLDPRTGAIEVSGGGLTRTLTVTQAGAIPYLSLAPVYHALGMSASAGREIAISANISWTATTAADWITITSDSTTTGDGTLIYSVDANLAPASRLSAITFTDGDRIWPFRVQQALSWHVALFANDGGSGAVSGSGYYTHGLPITVTATPTFGYHFANWAEDGIAVSTASEYTFDVMRNRTLTATFAINIYLLTYTAGANGAVDGTDVITQSVVHGCDAAPVTAIPDVGYYFLGWSDGVTANPRTDTNLLDDLTVEALFAQGEAPVITSADHTAFEIGVPGTFSVTTTGMPTPTLSLSGTLPGGLTFSEHGDGAATLSGTPAAGTSGVYTLTFTAINTILPDASQVFTLTVLEPPAITSANSVAFTVGAEGTFSVTATGVPAPTIIVDGDLPDGISFTAHGDGAATLSGTPAAGAGGVYALTFTASNGVLPDASQAFILTVFEAPAITSADSVTFAAGAEGTFSITATGVPTPAIAVDGDLPDGVSFTAHGDGAATLSGTPGAGAGGVYALIFTASNGVLPDASQGFTLTVLEAPAITSADSVTFTVGAEGTFSVTATGVPTPAIALDGDLPDGISFVAHGDGAATLSGIPATGMGGVYALTFTATNTILPDASQGFTLTILEAPAITSAGSVTFTVGAEGTFIVTATGVPTPAIAVDGDLPGGISFSDNGDGSATLSGTPAAGAGGVYALTFTASNGVLPDASHGFTLTVYELPQAGVVLIPDHTAQAQPGEVLTLTHVITNTGNIIDTFDLTIAGWGVLLTSTPLTLPQGAMATVQVEIAVPADATGGAVNTTVITATSRLDSAVFATARNVITVYAEDHFFVFLPLVLRNN